MPEFAAGRWERNLHRLRNEFLSKFVMSLLLNGLPEDFPIMRVLYHGLSRLRADQLLSQVILEKKLKHEVRSRLDDPRRYDSSLPRWPVDQEALHSRFPQHPERYSSELTNIFVVERVPSSTSIRRPPWNIFAQRLDGHAAYRVLGADMAEIGPLLIEHHNRTGEWMGSYIDLRLALLHRAREYHWAPPYTKEEVALFDASVDSLLTAIKSY